MQAAIACASCFLPLLACDQCRNDVDCFMQLFASTACMRPQASVAVLQESCSSRWDWLPALSVGEPRHTCAMHACCPLQTAAMCHAPRLLTMRLSPIMNQPIVAALPVFAQLVGAASWLPCLVNGTRVAWLCCTLSCMLAASCSLGGLLTCLGKAALRIYIYTTGGLLMPAGSVMN